jgi:ribosomal RNA assembly protein
MKTILSEKIPRIIKNKKKLQEILNIKISNRGKEVTIQGEPEDEYIAEKVIDAINFGFPFSHAISIKTEENELEIINIKEHTTKQNYERVRGRIIGKAGKTLKTISNLTNCYLELKDNKVGIICAPENLESAQEAIIEIVRGSKQTNVYSRAERNRYKEPVDLGLKG